MHDRLAVLARWPTEAQIRRAVTAARKCGLDPAGVEIAPDGTLRVLSASVLPAPAGGGKDGAQKPEPW